MGYGVIITHGPLPLGISRHLPQARSGRFWGRAALILDLGFAFSAVVYRMPHLTLSDRTGQQPLTNA
ncbi:MAG: hypothetical protein RLZZ597_1969 [Cyanobacteriota bacterium]|jgi:hypothetical protein